MTQDMSPLPVSTNSLIADSQMDFPSAMKAVIAGNKVSKLAIRYLN